MPKIKQLSLENPLPTSVLLMILAIFFTELPLDKAISGLIDAQSAFYIAAGLEQFLFSAFLILFIKRLGLWGSAGFNYPRHWRSVWLIWPILLLTLINGSGLLDGSLILDTSQPAHIFLFSLFYLSVGLFEEILCRGAVLLLLLQKWGSSKKGIYLAVLASSSLFALGHLINWLQGRYSPISDITQIFFGLFFGVFFAACFLRCKTIWPAILTHALFDMAGALQEISVGGTFQAFHDITLQVALVSIAFTLPLFLYGLFILRKVQVEQVSPAETLPLKFDLVKPF